MSLVSLFSDERGFLASDQLVYTAEELLQVQEAATMAAELASAIKEQTQINVAAKSAGFSAGYEEGKQQASAEAAQELQRNILELQRAYQRDVSAQKAACATLAIDIVRKIAGQVAPADWLYAEANTAAAELVDRTGLVLRVHSSQYDNLSKRVAGDNLFDRVVADESVAPDACSIDTRYGKIDVDIETQIEQVSHLLAMSETDEQ